MKADQQEIWDYCIQHSSKQDDLLIELERISHLRTLAPQMISGKLQGRMLSFISHMIQPKNILEIGTFTGYGTLCLAEGLSTDGTIYTIEVNQELNYISSDFFNKSIYKEQIRAFTGDAMEIIPTLETRFDLVYIDAGKIDNWKYLNLVLPLLRIGGFIIIDNVLWSGKILDPKDKVSKQIHDFNQKVMAHSQLENVILPIRDGMNLIRKVR